MWHVAGGRWKVEGATAVGSSGVAHFIYGKSKVLSYTKKRRRMRNIYIYIKREREEGREVDFIEMQERRTWQRDTKIEYEI